MRRPTKPAATIQRARKLRRSLSEPEVMLWRLLKGSPEGVKFRKQHPAGPYVIDFFCARANLAIEIDGLSHDMGARPQHDTRRDDWLRAHRIETVRIPASRVYADPVEVAQSILMLAQKRIARFAKTPPSALRAATSPSRDDGENFRSHE